jgi:hypothetical protein
VTVSGLFQGEDFAAYAGQETLVIMDIEGAEMELLDPERYPALQRMDVVVELHDVLQSDTSQKILERFRPTHDIEFIRNQNHLVDLQLFFKTDRYIDPFEHLLFGWEGRGGPTPWAVMKRKPIVKQ